MSKQLAVTVLVNSDGRCQFSDHQLATIHKFVSGFAGGAVTVSWAKPKSVRSLKQNAYLWGVVYSYIATHTGMTTEDVHDWCKDEFLPRRFVKLGSKEKEIRKTTTDLLVGEFNLYIEQVLAWSSTELGIAIPGPNDDGFADR